MIQQTDSARSNSQRPSPSDAGFTLIETVVAMSVLCVGVLALAQVLYVGVSLSTGSSNNLIAREKAREAIESVHTARDTRTIAWANIRNVNPPAGCPAGTTANGGGVFDEGVLDMEAAGPDGLVNTDDDDGTEMTPGLDNLLGTDDDVPLFGFTRQIAICDVDGNTNLRQIIVTIRYPGSTAVQNRRDYQLTTFISSFS